MPTPALCPGSCNTAWRRAEHALAVNGTPHDIPASWGTPVHCPGCVERTRRQLFELPNLLYAVGREQLHATRAPSVSTTHSAPTDTTPWPGQSARLLIDLVAGGLLETAAELLRLRGINSDRLLANGVREERRTNRAVTILERHLEWLLQEHPLATESHEPTRTGTVVIASGNPAAQIAHWHRAMVRFTHQDEAHAVQRLAPCKRCGGPWLAEARDLRLVNGLPYIECQSPDCGALLTQAEYHDHVRSLIGDVPTPAPARRPVTADVVDRQAVDDVLRGVLTDDRPPPRHPDDAPGETAA
ncbi:hypothetical protein ACIP98_21020 [Streptomyces sp. NPDC088354]|uniref:hypothetical protein n=1 Tax=Streptomyces sp. NPDC088354 TaxID=3365856 RepID=UPI0038220E74